MSRPSPGAYGQKSPELGIVVVEAVIAYKEALMLEAFAERVASLPDQSHSKRLDKIRRWEIARKKSAEALGLLKELLIDE